MAQLEEQSLSTPEVHGSNEVIDKNLLTVNCLEKTKIKKTPGMAHFLQFMGITTVGLFLFVANNNSPLFQCSGVTVLHKNGFMALAPADSVLMMV